MEKSNIRENILAFCKWSQENMQFLEKQDIIEEEEKKIVDEIMDGAVTYSRFYSMLEDIYYNGLAKQYNIDIGTHPFSRETFCKDVLTVGVAMLISYGLSDEEFDKWIAEQGKEPPFLILYGITQCSLPSEYLEKIKAYKRLDDEKYSISKYGCELIDDCHGISIKNEKSQNEMFQYRVFDKYIIYGDLFEKYNHAIGCLVKCFDVVEEKVEHTIKSTYKESSAYDNKFLQTMEKIVIETNDAFQKILLEVTRYLREQNVNVETISSYRNFYSKKADEYKQVCLRILEPIIDAYEKYYPIDEAHDHKYIDTALSVDSFRRFFMISDIDNEYKRTLAYVGNSALDDALRYFSHGIADGIFNALSQGDFASKLKNGLEKFGFEKFYSEGLFDEFRNEIEGAFLDALNICDYDLLNKEWPDEIEHLVYGYFTRPKDCEISEEEIKNVLLNSLICFPYHSEYVLGLIYMLYGEGAAEYDLILEHVLGLEEEFEEYLGDMIDDYVLDYLPTLPTDVLEDTLTALEKISKSNVSYRRLTCKEEYTQVWLDYQKDLTIIIKERERIHAIKQEIDAYIIEANDKKIIELAKRGNGYAQYMLLKMYRHLGRESLEFGWLETDDSFLGQYLKISFDKKRIKEHEFETLKKGADYNIAGAATLIAEYLFREGELDEGKKYLRKAENGGDPQAFANHARYIRDGKYEFNTNENLVKQLEEIASMYGIEIET